MKLGKSKKKNTKHNLNYRKFIEVLLFILYVCAHGKGGISSYGQWDALGPPHGESKPLTHITTHIALTKSLTLIRVLRPLDFFEKGPWIDYANLAPIQLYTS